MNPHDDPAGRRVRNLPETSGGAATATWWGDAEAGVSDRQALATLTATRGQDRPSRTGAHAQSETVDLVAAAVIRLVRTLAHGFGSLLDDDRWSPGVAMR